MLDDLNLDFPEETPPPQRPRSRRFLTMAGILAGILLLALLAIAVYALVILPQQQGPPAIDLAATSTALAIAQITDTSTPTGTQTATITDTSTPTNTPTDIPTATPITPVFTSLANSATQTVQALLTQAALAQTQAASGTQTPGTATPTPNVNILPDSGFGDNANLPGLLVASALLILVILGARRLRTSNS